MFELLQTDPRSKARRGRLTTAHGVIETPVFMPVGTQATVKAVSPDELRELRAQIILGNTYHLFVRPGMDVLRHFGGLHRFMAWGGPILTDSGGYQVFSLAKLRRITEAGVHFQNHLDGAPCFLGPEIAMQIQGALGSDIAMLFDECPPYPCDYDAAAESLERTLRWAERCQSVAIPGEKFAIVQGSSYPKLRRASAETLVALGFDGYAIGGVSVGEPESEMMAAVESAEPYLPVTKPRYAMGLGTPPQMVEMVARGVDMFDCVLPTRLARNGTAFTREGTLNLKNAPFAFDERPIEEGCTCPACRQFARGYLRHLIKAQEILGLRLLSLHNLHFYLSLMGRIRQAIETETFEAFKRSFVAGYRKRDSAT
ncbi:MAG: tRNA guanosine(34) transglycosylase Tgt [Verrucomicrobiota bacterium]|nr:tRNA guanosine(34) transglycosylase Tgt [Verrucomicrobiota bacterium]